jgi:hypothetical protein
MVLSMGLSASTAVRTAVAYAAVAVVVLLVGARAHADQRRDFVIDFQPEGTYLVLDYFGTGTQAALENRLRIYGSANDLTSGVGIIAAYPGLEAIARVDLRILFLGLGGTVGFRSIWRELTFEAGEDTYCVECDRGARRARDKLFGKTPGTNQYGWAEARANLYAPFNEYVVFVASGAARYEGRNDRSYDWFYTSVYDHGLLWRFEANLFLKHPDWGGIGPYIQMLSLPRAGQHDEQWAWGFNATTRLGLMPRNDLLFLTFLIRPGDDTYGQQTYFAPIRALLIYRMNLEL